MNDFNKATVSPSRPLICCAARDLPKPFYQDDFVTIYNADCKDIFNLMPSESIKLVIADPPYGMNYQSNFRKEKYKKIEGDDILQTEWVKDIARITKASSTIYIFSNENALEPVKQAMTKNKFQMKTMLVWDKMNCSGGDLEDYGKRCEYILHGSKMYKPKERKFGFRDSNLISIPRVPPSVMQHPTEKPVMLLNYLVMKSCGTTETVLDPFCGTGATLIAARQLGRKAIGIEIDERYCQIAKNRLAQSSLAF